jgi:hypothetical protein
MDSIPGTGNRIFSLASLEGACNIEDMTQNDWLFLAGCLFTSLAIARMLYNGNNR